LDELSAAEIAMHPPGPREGRLYTRLACGDHVVVGVGFVARRLEPLLQRLDGQGFDLIVLITTGVFQQFRLRTPFVHGQNVVDTWIGALVMDDCALGLIYPLTQQHRGFAHGTLIQNAHVVAAAGDSARLEDAAVRLAETDLILMHSVGYTEAMAQQIAALTRKPVVTARRIIAGAIRLHLENLAARPALAPNARAGLMDRLSGQGMPLTPREREVLAAVLEGESNKKIAQILGISHRTVEIHRGRALAKLNATSPTELIRRMMISESG